MGKFVSFFSYFYLIVDTNDNLEVDF